MDYDDDIPTTSRGRRARRRALPKPKPKTRDITETQRKKVAIERRNKAMLTYMRNQYKIWPKPAMGTAYQNFMRANRSLNPGISRHILSKKVARAWARMPTEEQAKYKQQVLRRPQPRWIQRIQKFLRKS